MNTPVKAVLLFSSGKVVFTGAKNRQAIEEAFNKLINQMKTY
jgi:TATA-box binding protein (TBP) (component of TFIID and TFIIIB)